MVSCAEGIDGGAERDQPGSVERTELDEDIGPVGRGWHLGILRQRLGAEIGEP